MGRGVRPKGWEKKEEEEEEKKKKKCTKQTSEKEGAPFTFRNLLSAPIDIVKSSKLLVNIDQVKRIWEKHVDGVDWRVVISFGVHPRPAVQCHIQLLGSHLVPLIEPLTQLEALLHPGKGKVFILGSPHPKTVHGRNGSATVAEKADASIWFQATLLAAFGIDKTAYTHHDGSGVRVPNVFGHKVARLQLRLEAILRFTFQDLVKIPIVSARCGDARVNCEFSCFL